MSLSKGLDAPSGSEIFEILQTISNPAEGHEMASARLGRLALVGRKVLETPNFLPVTSRGVIPHITPDVISNHTDVGGVYAALEDYTERAAKGTPPIMNSPSQTTPPLHRFTAVPSSLLTVLGPRRTPAVPAPTGSTDTSISVFSSTGFQPLSISSYINYVKFLQPDIAIGLADIPYGGQIGVKRLQKVGDRASKWLDELAEETRITECSSQDKKTAIFAPILPVDYYSQSDYLDHITDELAGSLSGLAFYSSDLLIELPATTSISHLIRLSLDEPSSPQQILRQISLGMDLFAIPFVGFTSDAGLAFVFQFPAPSTPSPSTNSKGEAMAIDLSNPCHATSLNPLAPGCSCYTCASHHRAYIQHLLSAREMLAWVLLQVHNLHTMSKFFSSIRQAIHSGEFERQRNDFEAFYESELPDGAGQKPRVRGYQYKSEGPGDVKRNQPAWGQLVEPNVNGSEEILIPREGSKHLEEKGFAQPLNQ